jgi:hypothetical protein
MLTNLKCTLALSHTHEDATMLLLAILGSSATGLQRLSVMCSQYLTLQGLQHLSCLTALTDLWVGSCGTFFESKLSSVVLEYKPIMLKSKVGGVSSAYCMIFASAQPSLIEPGLVITSYACRVLSAEVPPHPAHACRPDHRQPAFLLYKQHMQA